MTLRDYVLIAARNWIIIAATVVVGVVTGGILALTATATYTSSAQVLFTGHAPTSGQDLAYVGNYVQSRMQTYKNLGTSTSLMESVATSMGSGETPAELSGRIEIDVSQLNTVATVSATDTSAEGAAGTADTLAGILVDSVQKLEANETTGPDPDGADTDEQVAIRGVVTGKAEVPGAPSSPVVPLYLLTGLLAGLVVSVGVVAVREVLSVEVSSPAGEDP